MNRPWKGSNQIGITRRSFLHVSGSVAFGMGVNGCTGVRKAISKLKKLADDPSEEPASESDLLDEDTAVKGIFPVCWLSPL